MKGEWETGKEMFSLKLLTVLFGAASVDVGLVWLVFIFLVIVPSWKVHQS